MVTPDRTLGVLGGMGPAAGAEFLRLFTIRWPARLDQDHPRVILLSDPRIPDRSAALIGGGADPGPAIRNGLEFLVRWQVDLIAIPCNTAFAFIDRIAAQLPVPIVDTIGVSVEAARRLAPEGAWLLATQGTLAAGLYQQRAQRQAYPLLLPEPQAQAAVLQAIAAVKAGRLPEAAEHLRAAIDRLPDGGPSVVLLACSELSLAWRFTDRPGQAVDSVDALADECVRRLPLTKRS
jgi:aspartate racemase